MHVGHAIRRFASVASGSICGVLGLEGSISDSLLWNIFGIDLDVVFSSLGVASSLGGFGGEKQPQEVDTRLMWTGATLVLFGTIGYAIGSRPHEVKDQAKPKQE